MGKLADDLNRLSATAAQGNLLLKQAAVSASSAPTTPRPGPYYKDAWAQRRSHGRPPIGRVHKAGLIPQHSSCEQIMQHYDIIKELGKGSFSEVKLVRDKRTGHDRVCKLVNTAKMTPEVADLTKGEVKVLAGLDHPSIVKLYEFADDGPKRKLVLILEYIAGGDCGGMLEVSGTLSEARVTRLVHQLLVAVNCIHIRGIMHRDLKPQNMMLTRTLGPWDSPLLKLIDFGLAAHTRYSRDFVGTPAYMPPEVLAGIEDYTSQADMWSIGVIAAELLAGEPPFGKPDDFDGDMEPVFDNIRKYRQFEDISDTLENLPSWSSRSSPAKHFVRQLLKVNPARRLTAADAISHSWIEQCRPALGGLSPSIVRSMADFAAAPLLLRYCMLVLVARTGISEMPSLSSAFTDVDADENGSISKDELLDAISNSATCGWTPRNLDGQQIFAAADLGCNGQLGFTEFTAAAIFERCSKSVDRLAEQVFAALDDDRDGRLLLEHVQPLFGGYAFEALSRLPSDGHFGLDAWRLCVKLAASADAPAPSTHHSKGGASWRQEDAEVPLMAFFKHFMLDKLLCSACEQAHDDDEINWRNSGTIAVSNCYDPNLEVTVPCQDVPAAARLV
mmetsp:Transcript_102672/g.203830  ORF Transcript_102672/g.203830 Transcript_102672/m.203830 type:complete len:616 (-) Transcript_102672:12-1859(-)